MPIIYRHWFPCTITPENPHGKGYVGYTYKTVEERNRRRWRDPKDSVALKRAIAKYGKENMETVIVEQVSGSHGLVCEREKYWIAHFDDFGNGYNLTMGGSGFGAGEKHPMFGKKHSVEARQKISQARKGKYRSEEAKRKTSVSMSGEKNYWFGKTLSPETRQKLSENSRWLGKTGEKHNRTRPEYMQAKFEFVLLYPLGIKEARKQFHEKFEDIPRGTRNNWIRKWQAELETSTQPTTKED